MAEWIRVNGAEIEKTFFEENVQEAKGMLWEPISVGELEEHVHCIICGMAISPQSKGKAYKSAFAFLDGYCFDNFVSH